MGSPVVHFELWSQDPLRLKAFYAEAFGWAINPLALPGAEAVQYQAVDTQSAGAGIGGGIMKPQAGPVPGNMTCYIKVNDLAAAREKVVAAGGTVIVPEMPMGDMGSLALFMDPDGRVMGLWKLNKPA